MISMFKFIKEDGSMIALETGRGRFVLTVSPDPDYPGVCVDYQEPGKPTRDLAVIEHDLENDTVRTILWESSNSNLFDSSHIIQHQRPEHEGLHSLEQAIKKIDNTHAGLELEARLSDNKELFTLDLGYWGVDYNFYTIETIHISEVYLNDIIYCVEHHGWKFVQE